MFPHDDFAEIFDRKIHIQLENGDFSPSTDCKNLLYLLDMSSEVYKMIFSDKIDKKWLIKSNLLKMKLIKCNCQNVIVKMILIKRNWFDEIDKMKLIKLKWNKW